MNIFEATDSYEKWIRQYMPLIDADLEAKHVKMRDSAFPFLRATYYRWAQQYPDACPDLAKAPPLLAVADLHIENFGTWRDVEGRLVWGINDFDEAAELPYTSDLVRLATSACLAMGSGTLALGRKDACESILAGYRAAMTAAGPFVLEERHKGMREMALANLKSPPEFWDKLTRLPQLSGTPPADAEQAVRSLLPEPQAPCRFSTRQAGVGSLGRPRYTAVADYRGGSVGRECKALAPSAVVWANGETGTEILYQSILDRAVRCPDPFVRQAGRWIVRRLAPDSSKIEITALMAAKDLKRLFEAMGRETANIHHATPAAIPAVQAHLDAQPAGWLHKAAVVMAGLTDNDWQAWKGRL